MVASARLPAAAEPFDLGVDGLPAGSEVEALLALLSAGKGLWLGGAPAEGVALPAPDGPAVALPLPAAERRRADRFAREVLWPLLHDLVDATTCGDAGGWAAHRAVNSAFAAAIARRARQSDVVWAHGFELLSLAGALRRRGAAARTGLLLETPFPAPDLLVKLPCWRALLADLLEFDVVGVPARRDLQNLLACVRELVPAARVSSGADGSPATAALAAVRVRLAYQVRTLTLGVFPLGIDVAEVERQATQPAVTRRTETLRGRQAGRALVLGVDPLDATRGLPLKLRAYEAALERYPELRGKVSLTQVVVPGAGELLRSAAELKRELDRRVGEVNGRFGTAGWVPVRYLYRAPPRGELLALYRAADVRLQAPLKDGLSLAALESVAADRDGRGVLVLSEFAGAAEALAAGALLVNPCDVEGSAGALRRAVAMAPAERTARAAALRQAARELDLPTVLAAYLDVVGPRRGIAASLPIAVPVPATH